MDVLVMGDFIMHKEEQPNLELSTAAEEFWFRLNDAYELIFSSSCVRYVLCTQNFLYRSKVLFLVLQQTDLV